MGVLVLLRGCEAWVINKNQIQATKVKLKVSVEIKLKIHAYSLQRSVNRYKGRFV